MLGRVFLGRYETVRLLGEGGMGRVFLARHLQLGRQVVVKVMHDHVAKDPQFRQRFLRETLVMSRFQHPYAVTLYDASLDDPQGPCIVMEYIKGVSLDAVLRGDGRLPPARVARLLRQLCEVLQAAHADGIIHRDLKPANIMIVDAGTPYELLKVMDFGLAKLLAHDQRDPVGVTSSDFAVGTPGYMCPEQARGEEMDGRGDLYSVGVLLYEMLAGRQPFMGKSTMEMLLAHATEEPPPFARVGAGGAVSPALEQVVRACLAKHPADRPNNARELADRFEAALAQTLAPEAAPPRPVSLRPTSVQPAPVRPAALAALVPPTAPRGGSTNAPALRTPGLSAQGVAAPAPPPEPGTVVQHVEAWMPERIAAFKLRGFINDAGGEVVENQPGRIRVRLGNKGCAYVAPMRGLSWLGLDRRAGQIDMELRLQRVDGGRENQLHITVLLRPLAGDLGADLAWQNLCAQIYCDLRAYLMGQNGPDGAC